MVIALSRTLSVAVKRLPRLSWMTDTRTERIPAASWRSSPVERGLDLSPGAVVILDGGTRAAVGRQDGLAPEDRAPSGSHGASGTRARTW